jgi:phosphohistidine phosphatase SixA/ADP-ribose pyrophosphatase YjhB (NUDIX family)
MTEGLLAGGAVVWRPAAGDCEVLLVHRPKYDDWSLPKGKQEPGEHALLTAVREVEEETSVRPVLGPRLPTVEYLVRGRPKRVDYWSALSYRGQAAPAHEVDAVCWLPRRQAVERVSYPHDAELISALRVRQTTPLILVRHASAGQKEDWPGDDEQRPLDAKGFAEAQVLARLLACFAPVARVISSPAWRCTDTVRPYGESFGRSVEAEPVLAPPDRSTDFSARTSRGARVRKLIADLAAAGQPAVVCLHRENLPPALEAACGALSAPQAVPENPSLPKGGFWVVHAAAEELVALERYEPW